MSAAYVRTEGIGRNAVTVSQLSPEELAAWKEKNVQKGMESVKTPTKEAYMKLKAEGKKDSVIIKQYGMSNAAFYKWKTETLTDEERKATNLAKTTKTPAERAEDSKNTKVQETESNAGNEAPDASNEVKEQMRLLSAENKKLHEENYVWKIEKPALIKKQNEELANYQDIIKDKDAKIGALESNNEDLHGTVERLQKELERVRRELSLATTETVTANLKEVEWAKMMDEMKRQPLEMFPYQAPSVQMIGTGRVEKENEALKTSLKAIVGAYL